MGGAEKPISGRKFMLVFNMKKKKAIQPGGFKIGLLKQNS